MIYILAGEDDYSLRRYLDGLKSKLGDPSLLSANTTILEGQQITPDQLKLATETVPFLSDKRLVIVSGLLERFEPKERSRGKKAVPVQPAQNNYRPFAEVMGKVPDSTILVLVEHRECKGDLFREVSARAEIKIFKPLSGDVLKKEIRRRVAEEGGSISSEAVDLLAALIGGDLWTLSNEINKLVSFASGRRIEPADVKALVSYEREARIFDLVDAVLEFNVTLAERSLEQLLRDGDSTSHILAMLARQLRMIVRGRELKKQGLPDKEIQVRLGLKDFPFRKTMEQSGKYPLERLKQMYSRLLDTDLAIKTGRYEDDLALNLLVADLCQPLGRSKTATTR